MASRHPQVVDALWPDTPPELVTKRFWRALGDLRTHLGPDDSSERPDILIRSGDHYHPQRDEIACDLWDFQRHLSQASRAVGDSQAMVALRIAVDCRRGDFVSDADYLWAEATREDLRPRALDAHTRLAELEEACRRDDAALGVLEHATELDHYAEEVFRRHSRDDWDETDSVSATWRQLQRNLAELDLDPDPDPASFHLYRELADSDDPAHSVVAGRR